MGSGGREHALAWKLIQGPQAHQVYAAPGNPGIAAIARCLPCRAADVSSLTAAAEEFEIDLTVVGPEVPLAAGIVDAFRARHLRIFGPTAAAAELETSKVFAKQLMRRYRIPTAGFEVFANAAEALAYVRRIDRSVVVKADGLAAGKGVVVADTLAEAEKAIVDLMIHRVHGAAGERIIIEDRLDGREVSVLALASCGRVSLLLPAQDYKPAYDGDCGPNTGGMGAVAPASVAAGVVDRAVDEILEPVVRAMEREGRPYTGVLYAGIMVTQDGPRVLEFNCRWGDPEAQVILPLLASDLGAALIQVLEGPPPLLTWLQGAVACVVLASGGYPGTYQTGYPIAGLQDLPEGILIFHAGTAVRDGSVVTAGGRVLNVVGVAPSLEQAVGRAYAAVERIRFAGVQFRKDIGQTPGASGAIGSRSQVGAMVGGPTPMDDSAQR